MKRRYSMILIGMALAVFLPPPLAMAQAVTVLYDDHAIAVERTLADPNDLWVVPEDLPRINGFELKPEGACLDELCVPVLQDRGQRHVSSLAEASHGSTSRSWRASSSRRTLSTTTTMSGASARFPVTRTSFLNAAIAPDFALPNRAGELVRLSDFRGKKVFIVTWASW